MEVTTMLDLNMKSSWLFINEVWSLNSFSYVAKVEPGLLVFSQWQNVLKAMCAT